MLGAPKITKDVDRRRGNDAEGQVRTKCFEREAEGQNHECVRHFIRSGDTVLGVGEKEETCDLSKY